MPGPDPYAAAQAFLAAFVGAWTGAALPSVQFVAEGGEFPWDGEQVSVVIGAIRPVLPSSSTQMGPQRAVVFPLTVDLTVQVIRKRGAGITRSPSGRQTVLPSKAQDVKAGQKAGAELLAMVEALLAIRVNGSVVSHPTKIAVNGARPVGPQGDLTGVEGTVAILLGHP